jgi:hypothetical protein
MAGRLSSVAAFVNRGKEEARAGYLSSVAAFVNRGKEEEARAGY